MIKEGGVTVSKQNVYFANKPIENLARKYGTPLLIFSEQRLIDNFKSLHKAFKKYYPNTFIYYSIKTNYEIQILKSLKKVGCFGEIASSLELDVAKAAGFKGSDLIIDGPAWTDEDIMRVIKEDVSVLNVDSLDLMQRVNKIASKLNKKVRVSFRIYPEIKISLMKSFIESFISKFGIPYSKSMDAYKKIADFKFVVPIAISTHIGSMITDPSFYEKTIEKLVNLAARLKKELGLEIQYINLGGGFGVQSLNYYSIQNIILSKAGISKYLKAASIEEFAQKITKKFILQLKKNNLPNLRLILEPGRFIVSDSGIMLTKIVSVKDNWIFLNGGINLIPESIFFVRRGFIVPGKINSPLNKIYNIAGPTLNTADVLAEKQTLPIVQVGELVIVLDAGAYSLPRSNQFTMLRPAVLYITSSGQIKYLRREETSDDILRKLIM